MYFFGLKYMEGKIYFKFFSTTYTQNLHLSHFLKSETQTAEAHTKSAKPDLILSFQFQKTLFAKHNTQFFM